MKLFYFFLTILVLVTANTLVIAEQRPTRKVLFTLNRNEVLDEGEYYVEFTSSTDKFSAIVMDTITGCRTFVFNGRRLAQTTTRFEETFDFFDITYICATIENGYAFAYHNGNNEIVLNLGEQEFGPYYKAEIFHYLSFNEFSFKYIDEQQQEWINMSGKAYGPYTKAGIFANDGFAYELAGKWFENSNGKITGPFTGGSPHLCKYEGCGAISPNGQSYAFVWTDGKESKRFNLNVNGKCSNVFSICDCYNTIKVTDSGHYALKYHIDRGNYFIRIDGKEYGPYYYCSNPCMNNSGEWAFYYEKLNSEKKSEIWVLTSKSGEIGPFNKENSFWGAGISDLQLAEDGTLAYMIDHKKISIGNTIISSDDRISSLSLYDKDDYVWEFGKDDKWYVHTKLKNYGPYSYIHELEALDNGKFMFNFETNNGKQLTNNSGRIEVIEGGRYRIFEFTEVNEIQSPDQMHSFYSDYGYNYVVIDGVSVGHSAALRCWYEPKTNSFVWNSLEGRELVVYSFKL